MNGSTSIISGRGAAVLIDTPISLIGRGYVTCDSNARSRENHERSSSSLCFFVSIYSPRHSYIGRKQGSIVPRSFAMAKNTGARFLADDSRLHKLCQDGSLKKVKSYVEQLGSSSALADKLANRKGVFGYTPLHEAVASGNHQVLDFLLVTTSSAHVNCRANSGYTPLHLAASSGHGQCVRVLLKNGSDISITDEYGKTPKQTAELSSKSSIVRLLRSEGG